MNIITKIQTLAGAAVTWMLLASAIASAVVAEVGDDIPAVAEWGGNVIVWLATAVAVVRWVSPVAKADRGLG